MIKNCPVTSEDVDIAEKIYGKDILYLKGKTTRQTPKAVVQDLIQILRELKSRCQNVKLHIYMIYINKICFLTVIDKPICY